jgi:hypothetical protein
MKYVKILGLLAVAAAALMAFAGTASATRVTSPTGTTYGTGSANPIHASAEGHAVLHNPIAKIECGSTVNGHLSVNPGPTHAGPPVVTTPASGPITSLSFENCTNGWHVTVNAGGTLEVASLGKEYKGTVYSVGATVTSTRFGIECRYATTETTKIGTLNGGSPAKMVIEANIPFHGGSGLCGSGATAWTGTYKVTTPSSLFVD